MKQQHISDEEMAAAVIALELCMAEQYAASETTEEGEWRWQAAHRVATQRAAVFRAPVYPTWNSIERLRFADNGKSGILGL